MLKVSDLPESTLQSGAFLYCPECGAEWSATRGDYFWMPGDTELYCEDDGAQFMLARKSVHIIAA